MPKHTSSDPRKPISVWKETDSIDGEPVEALVIILRGPGCCWAKKAGCTMCGYNDPLQVTDVTSEELIEQARFALERYQNEPYIKIFTSGSFLDPIEIPLNAQKGILTLISERNDGVRLLLESRPEFVDVRRTEELSQIIGDLEIAIGLESSSDTIRSDHIRKGFSWNDYLTAGKILKDLGLKLKTYLLLKPPLLSESDAIEDCVSSIERICREFPGSRISINPMNIQKGTEVESLFKKGAYRPPWIWSLLEVMRRGYQISNGKVHLMSSPTGGGKKRGVNNCGVCDQRLLDLIQDFSISNDSDLLEGLEHICDLQWKEVIITGS